MIPSYVSIPYLVIVLIFFIAFMLKGGSDYIKGESLVILALMLAFIWPLYSIFYIISKIKDFINKKRQS